MKRPILFAALLLTAVLLAACRSAPDLETPPDIRYGEDVCEGCGMIINEPRHAVSYVLTDGTVRRFDDIGDMLAYDAKHQEDIHTYWVHDFQSEEWLMAKQATFVLSSDRKTPMGWGLLAFAEKTAAERYLAENSGTITTWDTLQTAVATGKLDPGTLSAHIQAHENMGHEGMSHDHDMNHEQNHDSGG